jgi:hypothetical protein
MTTETPDASDPFDTDLQKLFTGISPDAGFEDRLIAAVRQHRRMSIPVPVKRAALAAAAMLAVGVVGYFGNQGLSGNLHLTEAANREKCASNLHQMGLAILLYQDKKEEWDFGGGWTSAQNWTAWNGTSVTTKSHNYSYSTPFASNTNPSREQYKSSPTPAEDMPSPFTEVQHDNIYPGEKNAGGKQGQTGDEKRGLDSILLPYNGGGGTDVVTTPSNAMSGADSANAGEAVTRTPPAPPVKASLPTLYFRTESETGKQRDACVDTATQVTPTTPTHHGMAKGVYLNPIGTDVETAKLADGDQTRQASPNSNVSGLNSYSVSAVTSDRAKQVQSAAVTNPQIISGTLQLPSIDIQNLTGDETGSGATVHSSGNGHLIATNVDGGQKTTAPAATTTQPAAVIDDRKIIRTGTMEFDVDRFDTAQMQITKITLELGGFVGATDSTKLPNGKVRGSISVRVPPERLDVLVQSLRALGDLKSQQITAADITKEYTDIESELKADYAMQDRLLELIHNGKGAVKDLLAAENELGNWRAKIEKAEGMIRYYNGQVGLSTLTITLSERDIQTPATAIETETADVGIEADDVEKARNSALKAIDDVKGRIVEAELKRFDAGQLAARLVADVPPESAGAVIDQLKQLGKVARLEINRQASTSDGSNAVTAATPLKTERKPTRLLVSIYNLANVAPRRTTNVSLAATDVEAAYTALVSAAKSAGGRVVTSALDRGDPVKATGSMVLEFPPDKFESALTALHAQGDVLKLTLTENPDTQNSTEAKQGLTVQLVSLASVPPRESIQQTLAAPDVPGAYQAVLEAASAAHARVQSAQLNEQDRQNISADLQLEIPRALQPAFDKALAGAGGTIARTSTQSAQAEGTVDRKVALHLSITSADRLPARETTRLQVETADVDRATTDAQSAAIHAGGRVLEATVNRDNGKGLARVALDLPLDKSAEILQQIRNEGTVRGIDASRDPQAPAGPLAHAQILVEFTTTEAIVADQTGPWASVRQGLSTSIRGLLWSLQWVVVGLCLIGPWAVVGWVIWKLRGKFRNPKPESPNQ